MECCLDAGLIEDSAARHATGIQLGGTKQSAEEKQVFGTPGQEHRTKVSVSSDFSLANTSRLCQLTMKFPGDPSTYVGTGLLKAAMRNIPTRTAKIHIVTCAHNFVNQDPKTGDLVKCEKVTAHIGRDGEEQYIFKMPLTHFHVYPPYLEKQIFPNDFAIGVAVGGREIYDISCAMKRVHCIGHSFKLESSESIEIGGYPGEKCGEQWAMSGTVHACSEDFMTYVDINTTGGNSGSPVICNDFVCSTSRDRGDRVECRSRFSDEWTDDDVPVVVGVHVGFHGGANYATLISQAKYDWMNEIWEVDCGRA